MHFFVTENPFHFIMILAFYICSTFHYYLHGKRITLTNGLLFYSQASPWHMLKLEAREREKCSKGLGYLSLQHYNLNLLLQVHLKPISSSTDDDGNDTEQITKAL